MNLKKVEQIFFVAFLALNIALAFMLIQRDQRMNISPSAEALSVSEVMARNGVQLPEFQESELSLTYIQAAKNEALEENRGSLENQTGTTSNDNQLLTSILSQPLQIDLNGDYTLEEQELVNQFIAESVLYGEEYRFFKIDPVRNQIIYTQVVDGIPIADGTASLTFYLNENGEIISYAQRYLGPITKQGDPVKLMTDRRAVEILYQNNKISSNAIVRAPRLVFYRTLGLEDSAIYVPSWYVEVETTSEVRYYYVDGSSGVISSTLPLEENEEES